MGIAGIPTFARVVRGSVLVEKEKEYVDAARLLKFPTPRIIVLHILPNVLAPVIVLSTLSVAAAILAAAALSFVSGQAGAVLGCNLDAHMVGARPVVLRDAVADRLGGTPAIGQSGWRTPSAPAPVSPAELGALLDSRRPEVTALIGGAALALLVWLMLAKPF